MTQVVLRGGGLLPTTPTHQPEGDVVKTQTEPEREDIMVMDTKLKVIEILQVRHQETGSSLKASALFVCFFYLHSNFLSFLVVYFECTTGLQDFLSALYFQT